jgi:predicted PolB exonuclease-like 3'-5' exonuclease
VASPRQKGLIARSDDEVRAEMGDKFPKLIYHSIICIGGLVAHHEGEHWVGAAIGAPHVGERSEKAIISSFVGRIADLHPQLVTFNGASFDLPVLRYRAMVCGVARRDSPCVHTSTVIPKTQSICATCWLHLVPKIKPLCTSCVV